MNRSYRLELWSIFLLLGYPMTNPLSIPNSHDHGNNYPMILHYPLLFAILPEIDGNSF